MRCRASPMDATLDARSGASSSHSVGIRSVRLRVHIAAQLSGHYFPQFGEFGMKHNQRGKNHRIACFLLPVG
jgi:hypothetical protein